MKTKPAPNFAIHVLRQIPGYTYAEPRGMSPGGVVVGRSIHLPGGSGVATRWASTSTSTTGVHIGSLGNDSTAWAINNAGCIVGCLGPSNAAPPSASPSDGFWYPASSTVQFLSSVLSFPFVTVASDINGKGVLVGWFGDPTSLQAMSYDTTTPAIPPVRLGALSGYQRTFASAINNDGQIVGVAINSPPDSRLVLFENGTMEDLGPGLWAADINDHGVMVGTRQDSRSGAATAFIYETRGRREFVDLRPLTGHDSSQALSINNRGHIVGNSWSTSGSQFGKAFLYAEGTMHALRDLVTTPPPPPPSPPFTFDLWTAVAISDDDYVVGQGVLHVILPGKFTHPELLPFRLIPV